MKRISREGGGTRFFVPPSEVSYMKWMVAGGKVYPYCVWCGAYPMRLAGVTEDGRYIMKCFGCGEVVVRKTHPKILAMRAYDRRWKR